MTLGIGIIGATGYIGTPYRAEIRECNDVRIVALCARRQELLSQAAEEDQAELATAQWQQVVEHSDVDLVMVLTPDALHEEPVLAAASAGKAIFCEKPIGKNISEASSMNRAVETAGVASYVPFWTRYVPVFEKAREFIQDGKLGEVRGIMYRWHNPRPPAMPFTWRDDAELSAAGSIADVGSHAYDTLRYLLGEEATRVLTDARTLMPAKPDLGDINLDEAISWGSENATPQGVKRRRGSVPDYAQIAVEFPSGIIGSIVLSHASYLRKGFAPELEIHGTDASLSVNRITGELLIADSPDPARHLETIEDTGHCNRFKSHVFPAFEQPAPKHPTVRDGWLVQIFTDAAVASAERGAWVETNEFASQ